MATKSKKMIRVPRVQTKNQARIAGAKKAYKDGAPALSVLRLITGV